MTLIPESATTSIDDPDEWVDRHGDLLLQFAFARLGRLDAAEDAVQESLLAAWRARSSFDGRSSLRTWLVGILRRKIADHFRRVGRQVEAMAVMHAESEPPMFTSQGQWNAAVAPWTQSPDQLAENAEFWKIFEQCLDGLPAHFAQAFHLRELGQSTIEEICRLIDVTPQNLAVRLHRARALLRRCLEKKWFAPDDGE